MDHPKQLKELEVLANRARRGGLKVHHYPENNLVVIRVVPPPVATDVPASEKPVVPPAGV